MQLSKDVVSAGSDAACTASRSWSPCGVRALSLYPSRPHQSEELAGGSCSLVRAQEPQEAMSGRSPGEGNGCPLQYSCLENPMDRGAWWATVHRVAKSWT